MDDEQVTQVSQPEAEPQERVGQPQVSGSPGAGAQEPEGEYLTRHEALRLMKVMAEEFGRRGGQSYIDQAKVRERLEMVERTINALVEDGVLDQSQASMYRNKARVDLLTDAITAEPASRVDQGAAEVDPIQRIASTTLELSGLTEQDPEYQWLYGHADPVTWAETLRRAVAAKKARIAREGAKAAEAPKPASPPASPPRPEATAARAVELGGGGMPVTDLNSLYSAYEKAMRRGDRQEAERLYGEIRKIALGG